MLIPSHHSLVVGMEYEIHMVFVRAQNLLDIQGTGDEEGWREQELEDRSMWVHAPAFSGIRAGYHLSHPELPQGPLYLSWYFGTWNILPIGSACVFSFFMYWVPAKA